MVRKSKLPATEADSELPQVFIGVGANIGDRAGTMLRALRQIQLLQDTEIIQVSGFYNTEPVGLKEQNDFLNAVVQVRTLLSPEDLLRALQKIEQNLGRVRTIHWGPRTIDLDILCAGNVMSNTELLTLPHPELGKRRFVLAPFCELAPGFRVPGYNQTVQQLLQTTPDTGKVELIMTSCQVLKKLNEVD